MDRRITLAAAAVVLAAFAWVGAGIVSSIAGHLLYRPPEPQRKADTASSERPRRAPVKADFEVVTTRDLFKVTRARPADMNQQVAGDSERPLAQMGVKLKGTITGPSEIARAVIEDGGDQKLYRIGEAVKGATIIAVFRNKVILDVNGQQQMLVVEEEPSAGRVASRSGSVREPRRPRFASSAGDPMRTLDQLVGNARVVPYYRGGQPYGFRVSDVVEGSEIYNHGMRTGDIIKSVNGVPIRTPQDALNAYQELQSGSSVQLEVERQGTTTTVTVPLR